MDLQRNAELEGELADANRSDAAATHEPAELTDIIDAPAVQAMMDECFKIAGMPMAIIDLRGKVLVGVGWQDICTKFHRVHPETCRYCIESDTQLSAGVAAGEFKLYKCKNNMWDMATPIVVGGQHVGNLFLGQFFFEGESPDRGLFRAQARRYGFNEQEYLAALDRVPRLTRERVDNGMTFFIALANQLSLLSYSNIRLAKSLADRDALTASLQQLNRTLKALSDSNQALMRATDESVLLQEICRIIVEDCGHALTWIGLAEHDDNKTVRPVAYAGFEGGYLETLQVTWADVERGRGPTGTAIRTGQPCVCRNMRTDPKFAPWREQAMQRGYASSVAVPLMGENGAFGAITIYSSRPEGISEEEIRLLTELASDLAHGLTAIRLRQARDRAKAEAEEANRAKDHFLAVLSHELRTPLTPVFMTVSALEKDAGLPAWLRDDMCMIRRSIELEVKLIDDLLDLNRLARGKLILRMEELDVHSKVLSVIHMCQSDADTKGVAISSRLSADRVIVRADAGRLQQILWNLIKNAVKFTPAGGHIEVRSSNPSDGWLRVEVVDTGIGIAPETLPRLFDAFEQADSQITRQFGGLGLGLAISKALVVLHEGRITAASEGLGCGATFGVELPTITPSQKDQVGRASHMLPSVGGLNILCVEDHVPTADVLRRMLGKHGYQVTTAGSVGEARRVIESNNFDLLISDLGLPDGTGLEVIAALREKSPTAKGIALSGFGMDTDIERSRQAGFLEHLTKPVEMSTLLAVVARVAYAKPTPVE